MTSADVNECMTTLAELFPNSGLTDAELGLFETQLPKFERNDVVESIRTNRLKSRFNRPAFDQILAVCYESARNRPGGPKLVTPADRYVTTIARELAKANPKYQGRSEAELILRYHRFWWFRYKADNQERTDKRPLQTQAIEATRRDRQLDGMRQKCTADLVQSGMTIEAATSAADWLDAAPLMFDQWTAEQPA